MQNVIFIDYHRDNEFMVTSWAKALCGLIRFNTGISWGFQKNTSFRELCFYLLD